VKRSFPHGPTVLSGVASITKCILEMALAVLELGEAAFRNAKPDGRAKICTQSPGKSF
jgi:hypothetical protein